MSHFVEEPLSWRYGIEMNHAVEEFFVQNNELYTWVKSFYCFVEFLLLHIIFISKAFVYLISEIINLISYHNFFKHILKILTGILVIISSGKCKP